ncbi:UNVERIFIED_ORG: hypothetical protein J2Y81_008118 [Paraburkholderia sediminicola]|nr:hypothetical protein [Paraburkholderia sediminicola]
MTTLYHYCDANAFMSIVKNKKLWLSSTSKMNDLNEGSMITRALQKWSLADMGKPRLTL